MPRQKILQNYLFIIAILAMSNSFASTGLVQFNFDVGVLTQSHIDKLQLIADNHWNSYTRRYAQEILNEYYEGNFEVEPMVSAREGGVKRTNFAKDDLISVVQVFPNPASDYFIVQLALPTFVGEHQLLITDTNGKQMYRTQLVSGKQQLAISVQEWASSMYYVTIMKENTQIETKGINVVR